MRYYAAFLYLIVTVIILPSLKHIRPFSLGKSTITVIWGQVKKTKFPVSSSYHIYG